MSDVAIRPARAADHDAIEALQRRASLALPDYRDQLLAHPDAFGLDSGEIAAGRVLVAAGGSGLVGYANWIPGAAAGEAELDGLFVDPERWRSGVGRALVEAIANRVRADGCRRLNVVAGPAVDFYIRCGFAVSGKTETRFSTALLLTRRL